MEAEAERFRAELRAGREDQSQKTDAVVVVHNLAHELPHRQPTALAAFLQVAEAEGVPWVLAMTNKFAVSASQLRVLVGATIEAYGVPRDCAQVTNSSPYVVPFPQTSPPWALFARRKNLAVMPVQGLPALRRLLHRVLLPHEEAALQVIIP